MESACRRQRRKVGRYHGNDERIQIKALGVFVRYEFSAVTAVAAR